MSQGIIPFVYSNFSRSLVFVAVLLVGACAADETEHVSAPARQDAQQQEAVQVSEWYPTPKLQQSPYYVFTPGAGQNMQRQPVTAVPYGQTPAVAGQSWQAAPYPAQQPPLPQVQGGAGGWGDYGAARPQAYPATPYYQPAYPSTQPRYQQPVPQFQSPQAPVVQYQPYPEQSQYPPAQRPWGVPGGNQGGAAAGRQSMDTWQVPGQSPSWNPPVYNGYSVQDGTHPNSTVPGYYW